MKVLKAFRYELKPNKAQETLLKKHAGCSRFAYNWGLEENKRYYETVKNSKVKKKFLTAIDLHKRLNRLKRTKFPWMYEVSKCSPQEALRDLEKAFKNFFEGRAKFPRFKKKGRDDSFRLTGTIKVLLNKVQLPRLGKIRTKEPTNKFCGRILSATVKREADRWYVSIHVEVEIPDPEPVIGETCGIDLGLANFVTLSDGTKIEAPKPLSRLLRILRRRSRQHSRKKLGSKNRRKSAIRLAKLYRKIKNIRLDFLHKLSTRLARTKQVIVVESLNVKGMMKNPHLSRSISDVCWSKFITMLEYKTRWYGSTLIKAPEDYPSSKTCSNCGWRKEEMPLSVRTFRCENCGMVMDRDVNAARNLMNLMFGVPQVLREFTSVEMGGYSSAFTAGQCPSMKQKVVYGIKFHKP